MPNRDCVIVGGISVFLILSLMLLGCGNKVVEENYVDEINAEDNSALQAKMGNRETLDILYQDLYGETDQVDSLTFSDEKDFWGYSIVMRNGACVSIEYRYTTDDELYCVFEFKSKGWANLYAVNRTTGQVIPWRLENDEGPDTTNSEFTRAIEGKRNEDAQYFCNMEFEIEFDQGAIESEKREEIKEYFRDSIPELAEYGEYIEQKSDGKASLCIEFGDNWDVIDGAINGKLMEPLSESYCRVYVGEEWNDGTKVNWDWFFVRSDCREILYCYLPGEGCLTLKEWRESPFYHELGDDMTIRNVGYDILDCHRKFDPYAVSYAALHEPESSCYLMMKEFMEKMDKYLNGNELVYDDITSELDVDEELFQEMMSQIEQCKKKGYSIVSYDFLRFEEVFMDEDMVEIPIIVYYALPEEDGVIQYDTSQVYFYIKKEEDKYGLRKIVEIRKAQEKDLCVEGVVQLFLKEVI